MTAPGREFGEHHARFDIVGKPPCIEAVLQWTVDRSIQSAHLILLLATERCPRANDYNQHTFELRLRPTAKTDHGCQVRVKSASLSLTRRFPVWP
jgi:hypothetical protein